MTHGSGGRVDRKINTTHYGLLEQFWLEVFIKWILSEVKNKVD